MSSDFVEVELGEVAEIVDYVANGSFAALKENVTYSSVPDYAILVRLVDSNSGWSGNRVYVDKRSFDFLKKSSLVAGDIVVSNVGANAGLTFRVPVLDRPATLGPNSVRIRPRAHPKNQVMVDRDWLYYWLLSPVGQDKLASIKSGSAVPKFNKTDLRGLKIRVPSYDRQLFAGSMLSLLDSRIRILNDQCSVMSDISQAIFREWFIEFNPVRAKSESREPEGMSADIAALFPSEFVDSESGLIPKGWNLRTVGEIADVVKGKSYSSKDLVSGGSTALVTLKSFERGGGFRMDGFKPYVGPYKPAQVVRAGDVVLAFTDVTQAAELIGRPAIVVDVDEYETLVASLDVGIIRSALEGVSKEYIFGLLQSEAFLAHALAHTTGTTVLHLSKEAVPSFMAAIPPDLLIAAYSSIAEAIRSKVQSNIDIGRSLRSLRDLLLPALISGRMSTVPGRGMEAVIYD